MCTTCRIFWSDWFEPPQKLQFSFICPVLKFKWNIIKWSTVAKTTRFKITRNCDELRLFLEWFWWAFILPHMKHSTSIGICTIPAQQSWCNCRLVKYQNWMNSCWSENVIWLFCGRSPKRNLSLRPWWITMKCNGTLKLFSSNLDMRHTHLVLGTTHSQNLYHLFRTGRSRKPFTEMSHPKWLWHD